MILVGKDADYCTSNETIEQYEAVVVAGWFNALL